MECQNSIISYSKQSPDDVSLTEWQCNISAFVSTFMYRKDEKMLLISSKQTLIEI